MSSWTSLKGHLVLAHQRMKKFADVHRRELSFSPGERVLLKLRPYRLKSVARKANEKLAPRFYGPFEIVERIGAVAYRLQLPTNAQIHPVFHVSQLKPFKGSETKSQPLPPHLSDILELQVEPLEVLRGRWKSLGGKQVAEVLVKWTGLLDWEATWELLDVLQA